ncbi:heme ABC exporter ATP-binding protein CcmA [Profundibacterium mesophilum]|uniref:Cytochrome c biogenesis ATP-binding export protein CcmA n=1 Tax=Profundibacterium mesophilum KAUST100406-0324 TaxID=1037889 RepID=A0A921NTE3_9RHOB|nr:heme ABC exporter ATP-binding protein CcmA [Profundibacterium mesophilum]KAF0674816.1 Cytochrome c biogenesis ATP-binding export protein CcmA [Profundibacterium mesophilum KAUST100406-0324]
MSASAILEVADLAIARGGRAVISGVGFRLLPGRALILRGPNGIGKTTLLRTVAGLQAPLAGRIVMPADAIAYASHADGLKPTMTVAENLAFWAGIYGRTGRAAEAIDAFDLRPLRDRAAQHLSAGQRRRLGLARLLVTGRPIWALDEPTVSLDRPSVALFGQAVRAHLAQGGSALIATHIDFDFEAETLDLTPFRASERHGRAAIPVSQFDDDADGEAFA